MQSLSQDLIWWVTAVELPAMAGLFWLIWRTRSAGEQNAARLQSMLERRSEQLRDALGAFKLEVARTYASQTDLRDLEGRLVGHLLRIEAKLDVTALKAAALSAKK